MKKALVLFVFLISTCCFAQKIKLKDGVVTVDAIAWLKYSDCGAFDRTCSLLNNDNEELIFLKWIDVPGVEPVTASNKDGSLNYVVVKFLGYNQSFEVQKTQKGIIELLYNAKVINEAGVLDEEKAQRLVEKYGAEFSARTGAPTNTNTIIIKEEPRRSGININLGR
ncbi:MAG TPA: hypothetical protein VF581_06365 [Flavobacterium sp.]|jgi:hypothetical protein